MITPKNEKKPFLESHLHLLFFSFACPKEKNQKKKIPGSLAFGFPCKIACRGVAGNSLRSNSPATSPPALQFCFGCAAWDKKLLRSHNNEEGLVELPRESFLLLVLRTPATSCRYHPPPVCKGGSLSCTVLNRDYHQTVFSRFLHPMLRTGRLPVNNTDQA